MHSLSGASHEVSGCTCTRLTCFVVILPVIAVEGVVVLKEVTDCAMFCTMWVVLDDFSELMCMVLEWYCSLYCFGVVLSTVLKWYCPSYCFDAVLRTVLEWYCFWYCFNHRSCRIWKTFKDAPSDVLILKLGTFSPLRTFFSGWLGSNTPILKNASWLSRLGQSLVLVTIKVFSYFSPLNCK